MEVGDDLVKQGNPFAFGHPDPAFATVANSVDVGGQVPDVGEFQHAATVKGRFSRCQPSGSQRPLALAGLGGHPLELALNVEGVVVVDERGRQFGVGLAPGYILL